MTDGSGRFPLLRGLRQDIAFSIRSLGRSPGLAGAVIMTLVIGIAAAATVSTIAYKVLLEPVAIRRPSDVVVVWANSSTHAPDDFPIWGEEYKSFARIATGFDGIGAYEFHGTYPRLVQVADSTITVRGAGVSGTLFGVLGTHPLRGRLLRPDDDRVSAPPVVVISEALWKRAFAADSGIVGRRVTSLGQTATIVGVAPTTLDFPHGAELWAPLATYGGSHKDSILAFVNIVGRRKPGVSNRQVAAEFLAFLRNPDAVHFQSDRAYLPTFSSAVVPIEDIVNGKARPTVWLLAGAGALLLLATCVNVAILLLVRALSRQTEVSVRTALGASRGQIARQVVLESMTLSLIGGALGLAVSLIGTHVLFAVVPIDLPRLDGVDLTGTLVVATTLASVIAGLLVSVMPTFVVTRVESDAMLRSRGSAAGGRRAERVRSVLVGLQVATAVCAIAAAGLVVQSFANLRTLDLGFEPNHLLLVRMASNVPRIGPAESAQYRNRLDQLSDRIDALPGVTSVAPMYLAPFNAGGNDATFVHPGESDQDRGREPMVNVIMGSPAFLRTLGIPLRAGRTFTSADDDKAPPVALVDETYARQMWPGESPIGKQIGFRANGPFRTVVGVVGATHLRDLRVATGTLYIPVRQFGASLPSYLAVRTTGEPTRMIRTIRTAVKQADLGQMYVAGAESVDRMVDRELATPELSATLVGGFALCILILCGVGLHGSLSAYVRNRHHDIAVRLAVGADPANVSMSVLRRGALMVAAGALAGGIVVVAGGTALRAVVFGITPGDPLMLLGSIAAVLVIAAAACYLPARRSARINPVDVLRGE